VVTAFDDPAISFNKDELEFACINYNGIELINSNPALIANYSWYFSDTIYCSGTSSNLPTQGIQTSTQIISAMAVYEEAGCDTAYTSIPLSITFIPEPSLSSFAPQQTEYCIFDELQDSLAVLVNTEIPSSQVHYQWLVSESEDYSGASPISNATLSYYKPQEEEPGNFYYFCRVDFEDTYCESIQSELAAVTILPPSEFCFETLEIPNAISPNGDNFNDSWDVSYLGIYGSYKVNVWNQYGQLIFAGNEQSASWDGKFQSQNVPIGDYYYQIEIPLINRTFSGTLGINY
jgi:gliding motility-associated-like protein